MQAKQWKSGLATIGVGAVGALGMLGVIFGNIGSGQPEQTVGAVAPQANEQTVTTTTPPAAPVVSMATPIDTATTPSGFMPVRRP
jgi:hypothetical protein